MDTFTTLVVFNAKPTAAFVDGNRFLRLRRNTHWHYYASFDSLLSRAGLGESWERVDCS